MKKLCTLFVFLTALIIAYAQQPGKWIPQGENLLTSDYETRDLCAVNEQTVWALMCKVDAGTDTEYDCKVIRSTDGGTTWDVIDLDSLSISYAIGIFALSDTTAWITTGNDSTQQKAIYKTTNGGNSWVQQYVGSNIAFPPAVRFVNEQKGFFVDVFGKTSGITEDGGTTWSTNQLFPPGTPFFYWGHLSQNDWWDAKGDTLWWGTSLFISRSVDGGKTWTRLNTNLPEKNTIESIKFNEKGLGLAISDVSTVNGYNFLDKTILLQSQDFGTTWNRLDDLPFPISVLTYVPGTENAFIGVSGLWSQYGEQVGQYASAYTPDGGLTWQVIDRGIARNAIDFVSPTVGWAGRMKNFDYGNSNPVIFKWEGDFNTATKDIIKDDFIKVNPNPFTDQALLEFELKDNSIPLEIQVTDVLGRNLKSISLKNPNTGINQIPISFDAPAGLFFLTLRQGNALKTIKLLKR